MQGHNHERQFRGPDFDRIAKSNIRIAGCGAIGANLAILLGRMGAQHFMLVDKDRVSESNLGTQPWTTRDIGALKTAALKTRLREFNRNITIIEAYGDVCEKTFSKESTDFAWATTIDCFDNAKARQRCRDLWGEWHLLHVGMGNRYAEVVWDEKYRIPMDITGQDLCDYPLSATLVHATVVMAAECLIRHIIGEQKVGAVFTLSDMKMYMQGA